MSENIVGDMTIWEAVGNLSLPLLIGSEAFAVVGAIVWAFLYYTGLFKMAVYGALALGGAAGLISAIWIYRLALKQRKIQALEALENATHTE